MMSPVRVSLVAAGAFIVAAFVSVQRAPAPAGARVTPSITVGVVARAQSMACFTRCRETESVCASGCYESYGECRGGGMPEPDCRQSRSVCARTCRETQSACVQRCL